MTDGYHIAFASDAREIGGAEVFLARLAGALPSDVIVTVLAVHPPVIERVVAARPDATGVLTEFGVRRLRKDLSVIRPDLLHANLVAFPSCRPALLAARSLRIPFVIVDHLPTPGLSWRGRAVQRLLTRAAARRVSVGERSARLTERYGGLTAGVVGVIRNGTPAMPDRLRTWHSPPRVGTLSRLSRDKGLDVLLQALAELPSIELRIGGDGPERERLQTLCTSLGLQDRVAFLGQVSDTAAFFDSIDVFALPSRDEAMPLALLEAMHAGLPIVASDVGSITEAVVEGRTGLVVSADDVAGLAAAIARLTSDPDLAGQFGDAAKDAARAGHDLNVMAAQYDQMYREILRTR